MRCLFLSQLWPHLHKSSIVFKGSWDSSVNWLELKIEPPLANLACPNPWNTLFKFSVLNCILDVPTLVSCNAMWKTHMKIWCVNTHFYELGIQRSLYFFLKLCAWYPRHTLSIFKALCLSLQSFSQRFEKVGRRHIDVNAKHLPRLVWHKLKEKQTVFIFNISIQVFHFLVCKITVLICNNQTLLIDHSCNEQYFFANFNEPFTR